MQNLNSRLIARLKSQPKSVSLPEANDLRTLKAGAQALKSGVIDRVFFHCSKADALAQLEELKNFEKQITWVTDDLKDISEATFSCIKKKYDAKGKTYSPSDLKTLAAMDLYQAGYLLASGEVDCVVAGAVNTTANVIRASLRTVGLPKGVKTVSGSLFMEKYEGGKDASLIFADAGVVINPTAEQLVDIASETVKTWNNLYNSSKEPRVAFLSFSTNGSAKHPHSQKMAEACALFKERYPNVLADGDIQFDAAFVPEVAAKKCPDSPIAGRANVFVFPNLDAGNISYKMAQRLGGFQAYGPILQGLNGIYSDLSRGASAEDIESLIYISAIRSLTTTSL